MSERAIEATSRKEERRFFGYHEHFRSNVLLKFIRIYPRSSSCLFVSLLWRLIPWKRYLFYLVCYLGKYRSRYGVFVLFYFILFYSILFYFSPFLFYFILIYCGSEAIYFYSYLVSISRVFFLLYLDVFLRNLWIMNFFCTLKNFYGHSLENHNKNITKTLLYIIQKLKR